MGGIQRWWREITAPVVAPEVPKPIDRSGDYQEWFRERIGWGEHDPEHVRRISAGWVLTKFCKSYTTIIGASRAWCGVSMAMAYNKYGYKFPEQCETAAKWIGSGIGIDWRRVGIPRGATVVLGGDSYHVTTAAEDVPPGAQKGPMLGGNQPGNKINVTWYDFNERPVKWVCWPEKA